MKYKILLIMLIPICVFSQNWLKNIDEAKAIATEKQQPIILVFSGSDWCAPCIKLEKQTTNTEAFKNYAADNYVMLKADFPKRKKNKLSTEQQLHNDKLAEMYNKNGFFPLIVVLNSSGKTLGNLGYGKYSPENFIEKINSFVK